MKQEVISRKVFIRTLGCQMNVRDSEVICGLLRAMSYELTAKPEEADVIIFNTCSVRQHAEDKVWSEVGRIAKWSTGYRVQGTEHKKHGTRYTVRSTKKIVGIVGCMAKNYKEWIFERAPAVDFVVGPSDIHKIPEIIKKLSVSRKAGSRSGYSGIAGKRYPLSADNLLETKIWETDGESRLEEIYHTGFYEDQEHAYVVISEGCSNFCSYCVVPYVRGAMRNRNYRGILEEIEEAIDKGITKITLLGQNVNAYQSTVGFIKLLRLIDDIKGIKEFSFITSHPKDTALDLFKAMADLDKLKKYLHLPVQSGSDRILTLMNRGYTRKFYLDLAENYRKIVKNAVLTTDIIVGFPTEKEEDFQDTYNLVKDIRFDSAYIFKYSPRPHTEAQKLADDVEKKEKERRHALILELQKKIYKEKR